MGSDDEGSSDEEEFYDPDVYDEDDSSADNSPFPREKVQQYKIVPANDVLKEMNDCIQEVNKIFQIRPSLVKRLLVYFNWDKERLIDRYYSGNKQELFTEAGIGDIQVKLSRTDLQRQNSSKTQSESGDCMVCYQSSQAIIGLSCHHQYCAVCWQRYFYTQIMDRGISEGICCMDSQCVLVVTEKFILSMLKEKKVKDKYNMLVAKSFVDSNKLLRWCPYPDCGRCARVQSSEVRHIVCLCKSEWCFRCGLAFHAPLNDCKLLKKWLQKAIDDSETTNWLVVNTKECPKCHAVIEKNGGCNHMVCSNNSCKHEFCWICLGDWKPHGSQWYACNKYKEDEAEKNKLTKQRAALQRYIHYYNRYANHELSQKFEKVLERKMQCKMNAMLQENSMSWIEVQFMKDGSDILRHSRCTLKYTYIFAYYLAPSNETAIFEENQRDLEHATETLSKMLEEEEELVSEVLSEMKIRIQDQARYCENRRKVLLEHVQEGHDTESWQYRPELV